MGQTRKISKNNTKVFTDTDGSKCVKLHSTVIFRQLPDGTIVLDTGGWKTVTTKARMNQAFNEFGLPYGVSQKDGEWSLWNRNTNTTHGFPMSSLTIRPDGTVYI